MTGLKSFFYFILDDLPPELVTIFSKEKQKVFYTLQSILFLTQLPNFSCVKQSKPMILLKQICCSYYNFKKLVQASYCLCMSDIELYINCGWYAYSDLLHIKILFPQLVKHRYKWPHFNHRLRCTYAEKFSVIKSQPSFSLYIGFGMRDSRICLLGSERLPEMNFTFQRFWS